MFILSSNPAAKRRQVNQPPEQRRDPGQSMPPKIGGSSPLELSVLVPGWHSTTHQDCNRNRENFNQICLRRAPAINARRNSCSEIGKESTVTASRGARTLTLVLEDTRSPQTGRSKGKSNEKPQKNRSFRPVRTATGSCRTGRARRDRRPRLLPLRPLIPSHKRTRQMFKKAILSIALVLHMISAIPVAKAEIDVPGCFPCGR